MECAGVRGNDGARGDPTEGKGRNWIPGTSQFGHNLFKGFVPQLASKIRNAQKSETPTVAAHECRGLARIHREGGQGIQL